MAGCQATADAGSFPTDVCSQKRGKLHSPGEQTIDDVIFSNEQKAKRQILAEVKQREAVKRISVKYESGRVGLRKSTEMADNQEENKHATSNGDVVDSAKGGCKSDNRLSTYSENRIAYTTPLGDVEIIQMPEKEKPSVSNVKNAEFANDDSKETRPSSATSGYRSGGLSDAASDVSVKTVSSSSSGVSSSIGSSDTTTATTPENLALSEHEIAQVELFYQSHKTEVFVCRCMANIYFGNVTQKLVKEPDWKLYATGIPVLVLDTGMHHRVRRLYFLMAERGTGFVLWKDVLDNLSNYSAPNENFHSLKVSTDHTKLAGISFDETPNAEDFYRAYVRFTSNPDDDLMKLSAQRQTNKKEKRKSKYHGPKKAEISQPCCFVHMTTIQRPQIAPICQPDDFSHADVIDAGETWDNIPGRKIYTKYPFPSNNYSAQDKNSPVKTTPAIATYDETKCDQSNPAKFSTDV